MNIQHLKYALEIAATKSISKAARNLYMGQPNLSRSIRELEDDLGIVIFVRNPHGITITPEGEEFLQYARRIVSQIDEVEDIYKNGRKPKQSFSVCVPRSSYIGSAFTEFSKMLRTDMPADIFYKETNSLRTVRNVAKGDYNLGIIRYQSAFERYFRSLLEEKRLCSEPLTEFSYVLLMSKTHPLASKKEIHFNDLSDYIEITHSDPYVPFLPLTDVKKEELSRFVDKHIYVFERCSQFELLENVPATFMWVTPTPPQFCEKHGLIQRRCVDNSKVHCDVLIYREGYRLTETDECFIREVCAARDKYINGFTE